MIYLFLDLFLVHRQMTWSRTLNTHTHTHTRTHAHTHTHTHTLKNRSERIIIHFGTNDLKNNTPESIADNILSLA